jgi:hypothetical protein
MNLRTKQDMPEWAEGGIIDEEQSIQKYTDYSTFVLFYKRFMEILD